MSPAKNVTVSVNAVGFVIVTVEEKRSACTGVPGEFEFADPPLITTPLTRVVVAAIHVVPDAPAQIIWPLAVNNIPADAANGQRSGAATTAAAVRSFLVITLTSWQKSRTCHNLKANGVPSEVTL